MYPPLSNLLQYLPLPPELTPYIIDFDAPLTPTELRLEKDGLRPRPQVKAHYANASGPKYNPNAYRDVPGRERGHWMPCDAGTAAAPIRPHA